MAVVLLEKRFAKWAEKEGIDDARLLRAAAEVAAGQYEADLGGYLFKKRVAREGGGKSGGYRTILCFRKVGHDRMVFLHGFAKGAKANIDATERAVLKQLAASLLTATGAQIAALLEQGFLKRIGDAGHGPEK